MKICGQGHLCTKPMSLPRTQCGSSTRYRGRRVLSFELPSPPALRRMRKRNLDRYSLHHHMPQYLHSQWLPETTLPPLFATSLSRRTLTTRPAWRYTTAQSTSATFRYTRSLLLLDIHFRLALTQHCVISLLTFANAWMDPRMLSVPPQGRTITRAGQLHRMPPLER